MLTGIHDFGQYMQKEDQNEVNKIQKLRDHFSK